MPKLDKMKGEGCMGGAIYVDKDDNLMVVEGNSVDFLNCDVVVTSDSIVVYPANFQNAPFSIHKAIAGKKQVPPAHKHDRFIVEHQAVPFAKKKEAEQ